MSLSREEQDALLEIARDAIASAIDVANVGRVLDPPPGPEGPGLRSGAFVSIHVDNELRGCVGYPELELPLDEVVRRCAISAATADSRFSALTPAEWPRVSIEISVLGPIEPIADVSEIEVGRHGLIAQLGRRRGLLLPQVATEWGWDCEQFAGHACRKAGLPADAWRTGAQLFRFEAQVFGDL